MPAVLMQHMGASRWYRAGYGGTPRSISLRAPYVMSGTDAVFTISPVCDACY